MHTASPPAAATALVIGGGVAGMSAALSLSEAGTRVHLIDSDPDWKVYGAGITITGPTLRVMRRLGILDRVLAEGWTADGLLVCDAQGAVISEISTSAQALQGLPGAGGIMRPTLHRLLAERVRARDITVTLGVSVTSLEPGAPVRVTFSDGQEGSYDIAVGADGIFSQTREMLFPGFGGPRYVGQICWRLMTARHPSITRRTYFLGGPMKVGMNPVSPDEMYMFLLEPRAEPERLADAELPDRLAQLMAPYGGIIAEVRDGLGPDSRIVVRPLETIVLPDPWHCDGVVLIGDASHATTPQLASGAGMAMEDGVVLGECIAAAPDIGSALDAFMARRYDRCRLVVENSLRLGQLERTGATPLEQIHVVERALERLNEAY
ncbi:MAG: FAD-dependent monooxygenase [Pararhodobacter sp.]|nr:FAD-dependent monooxygenase [Pararhodobacter sp.]